MRVLRVVGRFAASRTPPASTPSASNISLARVPSASSPTTPTNVTSAPSARKLFATFPAPPSVNVWRPTLTTGTGASGEMRETSPQIHSSIIRSPTTRMRLPRIRVKSSRALGGASGSADAMRKRLIDEIANDVTHRDVHFLDDRGIAVRAHQDQVGDVGNFAAAVAGERNRERAVPLGGFEPVYDVTRIAAGRNADDDVARPRERFDLPREDVLVSEVVRDRRHGRGIR